MDFKFSEEDEAFRHEFRGWLSKNLPRDSRDDGELHDPDTKEEFERRRGWHRKLYDGGWMCIHWPKEYGGPGAGPLPQGVSSPERARAHTPPPPDLPRVGRPRPTPLSGGSAAPEPPTHPTTLPPPP